MSSGGFESAWERHYDSAVRAAAEHTFRTCANQGIQRVYLVLAEELRRRGIDPEPDAVFEGARLISSGRKPAVLTRPLPRHAATGWGSSST